MQRCPTPTAWPRSSRASRRSQSYAPTSTRSPQHPRALPPETSPRSQLGSTSWAESSTPSRPPIASASWSASSTLFAPSSRGRSIPSARRCESSRIASESSRAGRPVFQRTSSSSRSLFFARRLDELAAIQPSTLRGPDDVTRDQVDELVAGERAARDELTGRVNDLGNAVGGLAELPGRVDALAATAGTDEVARQGLAEVRAQLEGIGTRVGEAAGHELAELKARIDLLADGGVRRRGTPTARRASGPARRGRRTTRRLRSGDRRAPPAS